MIPSTMKAWRYANGITAKTLVGKLEESLVLDSAAPAPDPSALANDQVIVRVLSAALNPADYKMPESDWFGRFFGLGKDAQPGMDFSGRIVAAHPSNRTHTQGQLVFGSLAKASRFGTLGEFTVASTSEIAALPPGVGIDQAATLGTSAGTAYKSLLLPGVLKPDSHVLINGGSGGVGSFAVQLAKTMGAKVTATTSTRNAELVRGLGADSIIDYKKVKDLTTELSKGGQIFNIVIDNVGASADLYENCHGFLKNDGAYVQVALTPTWAGTMNALGKMSKSMLPGGRRKFCLVTDKGKGEDYSHFGQLVANGKVTPVIDEVFTMEDVPRAYAKLREGRSRGKLIVRVSEEGRDAK